MCVRACMCVCVCVCVCDHCNAVSVCLCTDAHLPVWVVVFGHLAELTIICYVLGEYLTHTHTHTYVYSLTHCWQILSATQHGAIPDTNWRITYWGSCANSWWCYQVGARLSEGSCVPHRAGTGTLSARDCTETTRCLQLLHIMTNTFSNRVVL